MEGKYNTVYRGYRVMANEHLHIREQIADIIIDSLRLYTTKHSKTFAVMFTITYPANVVRDDNTVMQEFMDRFTKHLEYRKLDPFYLWVRERDNSINHHYHFFLLLDGQHIQNHYGLAEEAKRLWGNINACNPGGLVDYSWEPWQLRSSSPEFQYEFTNCLFALSYLAKVNTKGSASYRHRDYGYSQLRRFRTTIGETS